MDDLPPLVSSDAGYPAGFADNQRRGTPWPATPSGGLWHSHPDAETATSHWSPQYGQQNHGWPQPMSTPQMLPNLPQLPHFPAAMPMTGMPSWPQGFGAPAVMTTPMFIPTNPIQDAGQGEDWVHVDREAEWRKEQWMNTPRPRSRSASHRAPSPFSADSSPSSKSSHSIGRSQSYRQRIREDDKRPPRDWRLDFSMTKPTAVGAVLGQLLSPRPRRTRSPSIRDFNSPSKTTLHKWLRYSSVPLMTLDLRQNTNGLRFKELDREVNSWDLTRFTCEPPVHSMCLVSDWYPWYIEVETSNPTGVTLHELFHAIWISMQTPIQNEDYWNSEMDNHVRALIAEAYERRCRGNEQEMSYGIRRVDFLMDRFMLEGFVKAKDGLYEMKIKRPSS